MDYTTVRNEIITYEHIINFLEKNNVNSDVMKELKEDIMFSCERQLNILKTQKKDIEYNLEVINTDIERYNYIISNLK